MAKLQEESKHLSFETLAVAVKTFTPSKCKTATCDAANPLHLYCAADLPPKWSIPKKKMAPRASVEGNPRSGAKLLNV